MNKLWKPVVACIAGYFFLGVTSRLINGVILMNEWMAAPIFRPWPEELARYHYLQLGHFLLVASAVFVYDRYVSLRPGSWVIRGAVFGLALSFLTYIPTYLVEYATLQLPGVVVAKAQALFSAVMVLLGIMIAFLYRVGPLARTGTGA